MKELNPKVKYNPGNAGDILKHSWFAEIVQFLAALNPHWPFTYADTFCGFRDYEIVGPLAQRLRHLIAETGLCKFHQRYIDRGRYAGSVTIVSDLLGDRVSIDIFDRNPKAIENFRGLPVHHLHLRSGYDILDMDKAYDLIFLDPYGDFWKVHREVIQKIHGKVRNSSLLLFASLENKRHWGQLIDLVREWGLVHVEGAVKGECSELDGRYHHGAIFFPSLKVSQGVFGDLTQNLQQTAAAVSEAIQARSLRIISRKHSLISP